MQHATLICHPSTPATCIERFDVRTGLIDEAKLFLQYIIEGELTAIRMPVRAAPRRAERLWEHTCLEAFLSTAGSTAYCEFNLAPSTAWAAYAFDRYRDGMKRLQMRCPPELTIRAGRYRWEMDARIGPPADWLKIGDDSAALLGACAVIESVRGTLSYWALKHPSDHPDFHHPDGFALKLDWPSSPGRPTRRP